MQKIQMSNGQGAPLHQGLCGPTSHLTSSKGLVIATQGTHPGPPSTQCSPPVVWTSHSRARTHAAVGPPRHYHTSLLVLSAISH
jgi:hypothetical protein